MNGTKEKASKKWYGDDETLRNFIMAESQLCPHADAELLGRMFSTLSTMNESLRSVFLKWMNTGAFDASFEIRGYTAERIRSYQPYYSMCSVFVIFNLLLRSYYEARARLEWPPENIRHAAIPGPTVQ